VSETVFLFGDESGTLVDPNDPAVIAALVVTTQPEPLRFIVPRVWRKYTLRKGKRSPIDEFKFREVEQVDRQRVLSALSQSQAELAVLIVEKGKQQIPDTPENYGLMWAEVIEMCQSYYPRAEMIVTLDRHFSKPVHQQAVSAMLVEWLALASAPNYANSQTNPFVQLADFVAGAFHRKHTRNDSSLADLVIERVVEQRILRWRDLKRKWLLRQETKNGKSPGESL
jgi:hypothetical protein